jgi:transcriptional regulator with XRE-family HTH domain
VREERFFEQAAKIPGTVRGRPGEPPHLVPRRPTSVLGWTMRNLRRVYGWTETRVAEGFGCSISHISRVEHGRSKPSRELVQFYEDAFEAEGMLLSLFEAVAYAPEQNRRRFGGHRPRRIKGIEGDATAFVDETIPQGTPMEPGTVFVKTWRIRNAGTVPWRNRQLERQGPLTGPGLISSPRHFPIPDTDPGEIVEIQAVLIAPTYDATSFAYFKMVDDNGFLCFPDEHQLGLDVLVRVDRNVAGYQDPPDH